MESAKEFRISLTVDDFEKTVAFYRDAVGLKLERDWSTAQGRCVLLSIEKATLEIMDDSQAILVDSVEVGKRVSGQIRFAFHFPNMEQAITLAEDKGAQSLHAPVETPWKDVNARLFGPDGMQMTFFCSATELNQR